MTQLTPPNPTPDAPVPAPTEPEKKGGAGKIGKIIGVIVVLGLLGFKFGWPFLSDYLDSRKFVVGACIDVDLNRPDGTIYDEINAVDCSSADAGAKIVAIFDGTAEDTDRLCPSTAFAGVQRDDKLFCVIEN